jgi:hypothetical protein
MRSPIHKVRAATILRAGFAAGAFVGAAALPVRAQVAQRPLTNLLARRDSLERALRAVNDSIAEAQRGQQAALPDTSFVGTTRGFFPTLGKYPNDGSLHLQAGQRLPVVSVERDSNDTRTLHWVVRYTDGRLYFIRGDMIQVEDSAKALAVFSGRRRPSTPLTVLGVAPSEPNSAGGVEMSVSFRNTDARRTIKYVNFTVTPYNAVGDVVRSTIGGEAARRLQVTGPIPPASPIEFRRWDPVWYNGTIECVVLNRVDVEYMDGSTQAFVRDLPTLLHPVVKNSCAYRGRAPHAAPRAPHLALRSSAP